MSAWTHIVAVLVVETYTELKTIESHVLEKLKDAPKITGSERNAQIIVTKQQGNTDSKVIITIVGNLRDRDKIKTKEEYKRFKQFLRSTKTKQGFRWDIYYESIKIYDTNPKKFEVAYGKI